MIELSDLIRELRQQLTTAAAEAGPAQFEVGQVELEVAVSVAREAGSEGRIRLWVVDATEEGLPAHSRTHRITLTLQPRAAGQVGNSVLVSDIDDDYVVGHSSPGPENDPDDDWSQD